MSDQRFLSVRVVLLLLLGLLVGCQTGPEGPDYARPLPEGASGLRLVTDPARMPDLAAAWAGRDSGLITALDRSIKWFEAPSSHSHYPFEQFTHQRAEASVRALRELMTSSRAPSEFAARVQAMFEVYESVGWDDRGTVLYTGYYSPVFRASLERTDRYQYPLYRRPADLVSDPVSGKVLGRRVGNLIVGYPTRRTIEETGMLKGLELVWLPSRLDAYIIEVNGSARLELPDGRILHVGYAGTNGAEYTSIGRLLVSRGLIDEEDLTLDSIRAYFQEHPDQLDDFIRLNDRFVFFQVYDGENWPAGSLGVKVEPWRSLATHKSVFPRAGMVIADTVVPEPDEGERRFTQFMLDQDTGGAIRAAGRADIYMGV
ncbi:MAG: MltA domain-containing protein, partial [Phycisphaeraceae bacterium]|nr:MltA domain-containing protein [Phycisphaeraceae bacterium]